MDRILNSKNGAVHVGEREFSESKSLPTSRHSYNDIELKDLRSEEVNNDNDVDAMGSVPMDVQDMQRMGKEQQLKRVFRQISLLSFTAICMCSWEFIIMANTQGLVDGGRAGLFWGYIWTVVGFAFLTASLAEMASMAPTAGGQYHWVSEFAPPRYQQILSYCSGWLSTLCWQAGNASGGFLVGTLIQSLMIIKDPNYAAPGWQGFLLVIPVMLVCVAFNVWGTGILPMMQNVIMVVHVFGFIAVVVVLWVLAPHVDAKTALLTFTNEGGWSSIGLALMIGQITSVSALGASDAAAHMAEEVQDAGLNVPRAMWWTFVINAAMGMLAMVTYVFCIPSVDDALNDPTGYPFLYVFQQAMPDSGTICLTVLLMLLMMVSNISYQASTARTTFAFARDKGLPFSDWIGKIDPKLHLPVNAVLLSAITTIALAAIYIGSPEAYNAIISLAACAQMGTYSISISCVFWRRITQPHKLPRTRWSLGRWGALVNGVSIAYAWTVFFWLFWPNATPVDAANFNYASVMFTAALIVAMVYFYVKARHHYKGPVFYTEGWRGSVVGN